MVREREEERVREKERQTPPQGEQHGGTGGDRKGSPPADHSEVMVGLRRKLEKVFALLSELYYPKS